MKNANRWTYSWAIQYLMSQPGVGDNVLRLSKIAPHAAIKNTEARYIKIQNSKQWDSTNICNRTQDFFFFFSI